MPLDFTTIDFETANNAAESACAVGLVRVRDGKIVETFSELFRPPVGYDFFSEFNMRVHGIRPADVANKPKWRDVAPNLIDFVSDDVLIAHNAQFDMSVLAAAAAAEGLTLPEIAYACSLMMARKSYSLESYRLNAVAYAAGHEEFNHHDALADAEACALIVIHMARHKHHVDDLAELMALTKQKLKTL